VLQPLVQIERAVQQAAAGAARPVALERLLRGGEHLRMMGEPQVVVGAHHDPLFAFDDDDGVFGMRDRPEIRVQTDGLELPGLVKLLHLSNRATCCRVSVVTHALRCDGWEIQPKG